MAFPKSQAVDVGSGVDMTLMNFPAKVTPEEDSVSGEIDFNEFREWSSKPTIAGQFRKEGLWKLGDLKAEVFNLSDPDQLAAYNKLLARTLPADAPEVIMSDLGDTKFYEGKFFTLVRYQEIKYRVLIKK